LDGLRIAWPDGWALVRPSVTEPLLTLRFEAYERVRLLDVQREIIARSPRLERLGVPMARES
jgi:phosphomannomutase/phosphoglucomutase